MAGSCVAVDHRSKTCRTEIDLRTKARAREVCSGRNPRKKLLVRTELSEGAAWRLFLPEFKRKQSLRRQISLQLAREFSLQEVVGSSF